MEVSKGLYAQTIRSRSIKAEAPRIIGPGRDPVAWARDGRLVYIGLEGDLRHTLVFPVSRTGLPEIPDGGIRSPEQARAIRGAQLVDGFDISPGPNPATFAYVKTTTQRNLFRMSLR
jgi:hypothetical protein